MIPTADPHVIIEEQSAGYVRYRSDEGRRWEVFGSCDRRGDCLIGAHIDGYGTIHGQADIEAAKAQLGADRLVSDIDVPVTPEFVTCCGADRFSYVELPPAEG